MSFNLYSTKKKSIQNYKLKFEPFRNAILDKKLPKFNQIILNSIKHKILLESHNKHIIIVYSLCVCVCVRVRTKASLTTKKTTLAQCQHGLMCFHE